MGMKIVIVGSFIVTAGLAGTLGARPPVGRPALVLTEQSTQVSINEGAAFRFFPPPPGPADPSVASVILLNSVLVENDENVGTAHGFCMTVGAGLSLEPDGSSVGRIAKCEQSLNLFGQGTIVMSGIINQDAFEAGTPQTLAITGGTGRFSKSRGEVRVTQVTFPGVIKKLEVFVSPSRDSM